MPRLIAVILLLAGAADARAEAGVYLEILGIAQDAGYPQAECYQAHCMRAWHDRSLRRLATSIAVVDPLSRATYLFDATPDIREQLFRLRESVRDDDVTLAGVFLTHAHMGHYAGLMHFGREAAGRRQLPVYAMPRMRKFLTNNGPWDQLVSLENIELRELQDGKPVRLGANLSVTPLLVPHRDEYSETVGFRIDGPERSALYLPDIDKWDRWHADLREVLQTVDYALLDATFYADGELPGRDMSRIPHPFVVETMRLLDDLTATERQRVLFIHLNHTNPLLIDGSAAQLEVAARGFRIAREGDRLPL